MNNQPWQSSDMAWRLVYLLVGIVGTLVGAWASHSVSKENLNEALRNQSAVINSRLDAIQANQNRKIDDLLELKIEVEHLRTEMENVKISLGLETPNPKVRRFKK